MFSMLINRVMHNNEVKVKDMHIQSYQIKVAIWL